MRLPEPHDPVDCARAWAGIGCQSLPAGLRPGPPTHSLRGSGCRCRLRRRAPSCLRPQPRRANAHPATHRPTDHETASRLLATHDEARVTAFPLRAALASGNHQQHAQTPARLRPSCSNLLVSMPRNRVARTDLEHNDPQTTKGFRQSKNVPFFLFPFFFLFLLATPAATSASPMSRATLFTTSLLDPPPSLPFLRGNHKGTNAENQRKCRRRERPKALRRCFVLH